MGEKGVGGKGEGVWHTFGARGEGGEERGGVGVIAPASQLMHVFGS